VKRNGIRFMTKAAQIRELFRQGKSTREIAMQVFSLDENSPKQLVEAKMAYVRVAARQRSREYISPEVTKPKAQEIMELLGFGKSAREIAMQVFKLDENSPVELVRSKMDCVYPVVRRRTGTGMPNNERRTRQQLKVIELQRRARLLRTTQSS
jgi:hypothetical protein